MAAYTQDDSEEFKTMVELECRGIEPRACLLGPGFAVVAASGAKFGDVNLEEGEWVEYDAKAQVSVGIYDLSHRFARL